MSTLYKRAYSYCLSWYCEPGCPKHPRGKTQHCISLRTKKIKQAARIQKDHDDLLAAHKALAALGLPLPSAPSTIADWSVHEFIDRYERKVLQEQLVTLNTWNRTERYALQSLLNFRPHATLPELDEAWVLDYQSAMKRRVAPSTWNSRRATLRAIFNRAVRWKWITVNPFVHLDHVKVIKKRPKRLWQEQLPIVLAACSRQWQLITLFFYATGCRLGELCNAKRTDVRWEQGYVEIPTNKENDPKLIALTPALRQVIRESEGLSNSDYIFSTNGRRMGEEGIKSKYDRISKIIGFQVSAHRFRHSHGTHRMEAGDTLINVRDTLGHADIRTTADFYIHVDLAAQGRAMQLLPIDILLDIPSNNS